MMDIEDRLKEKYRIVYQKLAEAYGTPTWRQHLPPVDELVSTILSQSTSDGNRDRGFYALKERYPSWESVMHAPAAEIIETIRPAGLANQKGPRIQAALRHLLDHQGQIGLEFLEELSLEEAQRWLTGIRGVGRKTAAIILLFSFGRPAFPVDTHVHRISRRLGLISPKVTADKAHDILQNIGDPQTFYAFHLNLIQHGRQVCRARKPACDICPVSRLCDDYQMRQTGVQSRVEGD
jgi:endonuclease-3